jgi:hypothetical protein
VNLIIKYFFKLEEELKLPLAKVPGGRGVQTAC